MQPGDAAVNTDPSLKTVNCDMADSTENRTSTIASSMALRRCILENLYAWFKDYPLAGIELSQLAQSCDTTARELNWNIVYLEKKGWVALDSSTDCPPYAACTVGLTGSGIDLVENPEALSQKLPLK